jgi:hypothetical protein
MIHVVVKFYFFILCNRKNYCTNTYIYISVCFGRPNTRSSVLVYHTWYIHSSDSYVESTPTHISVNEYPNS